MRRRRQGLQVSTFPFLAVLLCTMGSLILLLLVIDRRAKVEAQVKARLAAAQAAAENEKTAATRCAELESRRQALHAALAEQDQDVMTQVWALQEQTEAIRNTMRAEEARGRTFQERLQVERDRLRRGEEEIVVSRSEAARAAQQVQGSQAELGRLTADLRRAEQTLADLKAARQRQEQTYSLVPYRGRRGDNRRPLYVECTADGLIFHPDRLALEHLQMSEVAVRAEVERRIAQQRAALQAASPGQAEPPPYLLMLVRPDGITSYYRTLPALEGLKVDYGYEFVEADWVLDFSSADGAQPWMQAGKAVPLPPPAKAGPPVPAAANPTPGGPRGVYYGTGVGP